MTYKAQAEHVLSTYPSPEDFTSRVFTRLHRESQLVPCNPILTQWFLVIQNLYEQNIPRSLPPEPYPDTIDHARWRDVCIKSCTPLDIDYMEKYLVYVIQTFTGLLPPAACASPDVAYDRQETSQFTVPLADLVDPARLIEHALFMPFYVKEVGNLFEDLRHRFWRSCPKTRDDKPILPTEYKGDPFDFIRGTPFIILFDAQVPITIAEETRFAGTWVVAPAGRGKTTLLLKMLEEDICGEGSVIIMDSKGDLIKPIRDLKHIRKDLVIIEPDLDYPLALNPLDIGGDQRNIPHTLSLLEYIFSALLEAKMTALQSTLFRCCLRATLYAPNPTINTFREIIKTGPARTVKLPLDLFEFFQHEFPDAKTYGETRKQIQWRMRLLMENPYIQSMFSAPKTKLNLGQEMQNGKVIIINNSKGLLGDEGAEFFGRFFIALVLAAAQKRAGLQDYQKRPCYFYIDECQTVIKRDEKIPTILDECRSQKIALILAHQRCAQLTEPVLNSVANCAIRFANSDDEATILAPKLRTSVEQLRALPRGSFRAFIRDLGSFTIRVPMHDLEVLPRMDPEEQEQLKSLMRERYSYALETPETSQKRPEHTGTHLDNLNTEPSKDW